MLILQLLSLLQLNEAGVVVVVVVVAIVDEFVIVGREVRQSCM